MRITNVNASTPRVILMMPEIPNEDARILLALTLLTGRGELNSVSGLWSPEELQRVDELDHL